jgi:hypothetical protein
MNMIMDEEHLSEDLRRILADRFEGWELVELLAVSSEDIISIFEEDILENLDFILEEADITQDYYEGD